MNLAKGQINKVLGVRQTPQQTGAKLVPRIEQLQKFANQPENPTNKEATEKVQKYLEAFKSTLTGEDASDGDKKATIETLMSYELYNSNNVSSGNSEPAPASNQSSVDQSHNQSNQNQNASSDNANASASSTSAASNITSVPFSAINKKNLVSLLIFNLHNLPFECKKYTSTVVSCLFHKKDESSIVSYFADEPKIITHLLSYYSEESEFADCLNAGEILRELCKVQELTKIIIDNHWETFIKLANLQGFDKLADALQLFTDILTRHKTVASNFLTKNSKPFFQKFNEELIGEECNFVTKKQCIKLLAQILSEKNNYRVMLSYVTGAENLKVIMKLLQDRSPNIAFEAFHVFKIFVANPNVEKAEKVARLLYINKSRLTEFLRSFQNEKHEDEAFDEFESEKSYLIQKISEIQDPNRNHVQAPAQETQAIGTTTNSAPVVQSAQSSGDAVGTVEKATEQSSEAAATNE